MIDTHSHIYLEEFEEDYYEVIKRAKEIGVTHIILPNVDRFSLKRMLNLEALYPGYCYATIGLHPTSVTADYRADLSLMQSELKRRNWIGIGEIGIDLYWDKTFISEQISVFRTQLEWALMYNLPVIIHVRDSFDETMEVLVDYKDKGLRGVFHSFTGTIDQAKRIIAFGGFFLGINGIVTFKNSGLALALEQISLKHLLLETDAPYLTPVPYRGKRNESAYTQFILSKLAEIYQCSPEVVDNQTTLNAKLLFNL